MLFEKLSSKMTNIFRKLRSKGKLTETDVELAIREIKLALLEADVDFNVVKEFTSSLYSKAVGQEVLKSLTPEQQIVKIVKDELVELMQHEKRTNEIVFPSKSPCVVMVCGLQGSGKTTFSGKLAKYYLKKGHRPLLVACDVYRPAAVEQLKVVGKDAGVEVFSLENENPVEIAKKSLKYAEDYGHDLIIIDTAGRLQIDEKLMLELRKLKESLKINETLFVVDAMAGQNIVNVAKKFNENVDYNGVVITKLDGDSRGGAALSILKTIKKPVKFIGIGEKLEEIEQFNAERMASRILGMGDILSLVEKAQSNIKLEDAEKITEKLKKNNFDMEDLLNQMKQIKKMGSIKSIISMIPGMAGKINDEALEKGEDKIKRVEAIINSMTKKEKQDPSIINYSRKKRISKGSCSTINEINQLLNQFTQMKKIFKKIKNKKGLFNIPFLKT